MLLICIIDMSLKITDLRLHSHLPGAMLTESYFWHNYVNEGINNEMPHTQYGFMTECLVDYFCVMCDIGNVVEISVISQANYFRVISRMNHVSFVSCIICNMQIFKAMQVAAFVLLLSHWFIKQYV